GDHGEVGYARLVRRRVSGGREVGVGLPPEGGGNSGSSKMANRCQRFSAGTRRIGRAKRTVGSAWLPLGDSAIVRALSEAGGFSCDTFFLRDLVPDGSSCSRPESGPRHFQSRAANPRAICLALRRQRAM